MMDTDLLTERLTGLTDTVDLPGTTTNDDIGRGRRRLRWRRTVAAAGSLAAVAAISGGAWALGLGRYEEVPVAHAPADRQDKVEGDVAADGPALTRDEQLEGVFAEAESAGYSLDEVLAMVGLVRDSFGSEEPVSVAIGEATSWKDSGAPTCPAGWSCEDADVKDASRAKLASKGETSQVVAQFPDRVLVLTYTSADSVGPDLAYRASADTNTEIHLLGDDPSS